MAETEAPPPVQEADHPQVAPNLATSRMATLAAAIGQQDVSDADLSRAAKRAYDELVERSGGTEQAVRSLDALQQAGVLNADLADKFRTAMTAANGDGNKFAEEIVRQRQDITQILIAQQSAINTSAYPTGDNPFTQMFGNMQNNPFMQFLDQLLQAFTGGKMTLSGMMDRLGDQQHGASADHQGEQRTGADHHAADDHHADEGHHDHSGGQTERHEGPATYVVHTSGQGGEPVVDHDEGTVRIDGQRASQYFGAHANPDVTLVAAVSPYGPGPGAGADDFGLGVNWGTRQTTLAV